MEALSPAWAGQLEVWAAALGVDLAPEVLAGGLAAVLLVLLLSAGLWAGPLRLNRALEPGYRNRNGRQALRMARRAARAGRWAEAGDRFAAAGCTDAAVDAFKRAKQLGRAIDALVAARRTAEAATLARTQAKWSQAARLYRQAGEAQRAADMFERAGERIEAADSWLTAGEAERAGRLYLQAGEHARAVEALGGTDDREAFLEAFLPHWERELERQFGVLEPADLWRSQLERAFEDARSLDRHEIRFRIGGYLGRWPEAAAAAEALGRWAEARRIYASIGDADGEARMAEALGEGQAAASVRAQSAAAAGRHDEAARLWESAGEPERALTAWQEAGVPAEVARVAESTGKLEIAAEAWRAAGQPARAAVLLERLENWERAAQAYAEAVNPQRAAECFRKAACWAEAAGQARAAGDDQAAIRDWQAHLRTHPEDRDAIHAILELMMAEGMQGAALSLIEPLLAQRPQNEADADLLYRGAMLYEAERRFGDAVRAYERILAFDVGYRDARERAAQLRRVHDISLGSSLGSNPGPRGGVPAEDGGDTRRVLDRYETQGELGRGGMGVVLKARDRLLERTVALKLVRAGGAGVEALLQEARATARLNHPNIVQIYDCSVAQETLVMAMEYVEGETVKALIDGNGPLPLNAVLLIFGQVAKALEYAHGQGIIHRDIKPANMLWTADKKVKLTDFGLARLSQDLAGGQTTVVGSPHYMSPEQITGGAIDARADLYALGVSLFEACTGSLPFPRGDAGYQHIHTPAPDPRQWRDELPPALGALILELMAKQPQERPAAAGTVFERLRAAIRG